MIKNKINLVVLGIVLMAAVTFGGFFLMQKSPKAYTAKIYPVLEIIKTTDSGIVKNISVNVGEEVTKGQLLAEIESLTELKNTAKTVNNTELPAAKVKLNKAEEEYTNAAFMYKDGVISQEDYDETLASLKTAQDAYQNAVWRSKNIKQPANVTIKQSTKITSPADGIVENLTIKNGTKLNKGDTILQLTLKEKKITAYVDKKTSLKLSAGQQVQIQVPEKEGKTFKGTITSINTEYNDDGLFEVSISLVSDVDTADFSSTQNAKVYFYNK